MNKEELKTVKIDLSSLDIKTSFNQAGVSWSLIN